MFNASLEEKKGFFLKFLFNFFWGTLSVLNFFFFWVWGKKRGLRLIDFKSILNNSRIKLVLLFAPGSFFHFFKMVGFYSFWGPPKSPQKTKNPFTGSLS